MQIVHQGFDGLDVTFQGQLPHAFMDVLEEAQLRAQEDGKNALAEYNGVSFHVERSGAVGGYKFRLDTGPFGAKWFFKDTRKRNKDPWNIKVSCHSLALASLGLGRVRNDIYAFLEAIDARLPIDAERISRIDYAVDFFAPDFVLDPDAFVMHQRFNRETNKELMTGNGNSGRLGSIRIGKSPGMQAVVYDKRAEVIAKRKLYWWKIWEAGGLPKTINQKDPATSRIWRVEIRVGAKYIRKQWGLKTWQDLFDKCGSVFLSVTDKIRYTDPNNDHNRSRWPNHRIWVCTQRAMHEDLFEMFSDSDHDTIREVIRIEHTRMIKAQILGSMANLGATISSSELEPQETINELLSILKLELNSNKPKFLESLYKAQKRYSFI
jgi:hypothetical protein